jgi:hypothetical protein
MLNIRVIEKHVGLCNNGLTNAKQPYKSEKLLNRTTAAEN